MPKCRRRRMKSKCECDAIKGEEKSKENQVNHHNVFQLYFVWFKQSNLFLYKQGRAIFGRRKGLVCMKHNLCHSRKRNDKMSYFTLREVLLMY